VGIMGLGWDGSPWDEGELWRMGLGDWDRVDWRENEQRLPVRGEDVAEYD
jgi:hypothetical protein